MVHRRPSRLRRPPGAALSCAAIGLALAAGLAACSSPVRLATPQEVKQAAQPSAAPSSGSATAPSPAPGGASGSGALAQLQNDLRQVIARVNPSVVQINTSAGLGSGVIMDTAGDIVTNAHVVGSDQSFTVKTSDGHSYQASLIGSYPGNDLAVIKASGAGGLQPASFGDSSKVQVGDIVLAIGSPLGLSDSVSEGIISATGRSQDEGNGVVLTDLLQTTAAINQGNSGGALVDISGQVIGIPTLGASSSPRGGAAAGIGFAISSNQVTNVTRQLISSGAVTHTNVAYLGITTSSSSSGGGALVASVVSGGPAEHAGVQSGWVITSLGGHSVSDPSAISQILSGYKPGDQVQLTAQLPDGSSRTVNVTLGERPATP